MYKYMRLAVYPVILATLIGCSADIDPGRHLLDKDKFFWSLKLNHRAVNISTNAPYDTVTLEAKAYTANGDEIEGLTNVTLLSQSENVVVFPGGIIKGFKQTAASGVFVIATATINGVTLEDTAKIVVTNVVSPPKFKDINPSLNNNKTYVTMVHLYDLDPSAVEPHVVDSADNAIPRLILNYRSRTKYGLNFDDSWNGLLLPIQKGSHVVDIDGYVYGRKISDSITIKVMDRRVQIHTVSPDLGIPRESYISLGGGVYWLNHTDDSLDIEFENPEMAKQSCCTLLGMLLASDSGNIKPFQRDMSKPVIAKPCFICFPRVEPDIGQGRSFHVPGRYKYTSRKNPNIWGTIIVSDPNSN